MYSKRVLVLLLPLAVAVTACGSTPAKSTTPTTVKAVTTTTAQPIVAKSVTIDGKAVAVPTEDGTDPIKPFSDTGQQVVLTASGFLPRTLYSALKTPVVFTNLTSHPVVLTLEHVGVAPVTIPAGGSYSWTPNVLDFGYVSSTKDSGTVNVGAFGQ